MHRYFTDLLTKSYEPQGGSSGHTIYRSTGKGDTIMLATDIALLQDASLRAWVEKFAADSSRFRGGTP